MVKRASANTFPNLSEEELNSLITGLIEAINNEVRSTIYINYIVPKEEPDDDN